MATATARLASNTGDGSRRSSSAWSTAIWRQSVAAADGAVACQAAMAAWSWYGPAPAQGPDHQGIALGDPRPVPAGAVLVAEQDRAALVVGAGVPPGVGEQQPGQQALGLRLGRHQLHQGPGQAQGDVAQLAAHQVVARGGGVALGEDEVHDPPRSSPEATMAKRLVRARAKIRSSGIPFRVPGPDDIPDQHMNTRPSWSSAKPVDRSPAPASGVGGEPPGGGHRGLAQRTEQEQVAHRSPPRGRPRSPASPP
jgi:hypothetical protein